MTIEVTGPDNTVHEFPDGTNPSVIKTVMGKQYGVTGSTVGSVGGQFARGAVNGVAGGIAGVGSMFARGIFGPQMGDALMGAEHNLVSRIPGAAQAQTWLAQQPRNIAERVANTVGQVLPGVAFGPEDGASVASQLATRVGRNVIAPAAGSLTGRYGAQAAGATPAQQDTAANVGAMVGGVGANLRVSRPAIPSAISEAANGPIPKIGDVRRAVQYVARNTQNENPTMIVARQQGTPVPLYATAGPEGIKAMKVLTAKPGTTAAALQDVAGVPNNPDKAGLIQGFPTRAQAVIHTATGISPAAARGDMESLSEDMRSGSDGTRSLYNQSIGTQDAPITATMTQPLASVLQEPKVADAVALAQKIVGKNATAAGIKIDPDTGAQVLDENTKEPIIEQQPTAYTLDLGKKILGKSVARDPSGAVITSGKQGVGNLEIQHHMGTFTDALAGNESNGIEPAIPGYRDALNSAGDVLSMEGAFKRGQQTFLSPFTPHADFAAEFNGLAPSDQEAFKAGAVNAIHEGLDKGTLGTRAFTKPIQQAKMTTAFGPDATESILNGMGQEYTLKDALTQGQAANGSQTGTISQGAAAMDAPQGFMQRMLAHVPPMIGSTLVAGPHGAAGYVVGQLGKTAAGWQPFAMSQPARDLAGQLMLSPSMTGSDVQGLLGQMKSSVGLISTPNFGLLPSPNSTAFPGM